MSMWTRFYQHVSGGGRSKFANLTNGPNYRLIPYSELNSASLNDSISSFDASVAANEAGGYVVLFQDAGCRGRYAMFPCSPGQSMRISNLKNEDFNDRTSSALLVRRYSGEMPPIPLGDVGSPSLRQQLGQYIDAVPRIGLRGQPIITWDTWPDAVSSSNYVNVYARVPIRVDVPGWFDYDAEIRFWIHLYINSVGKLGAYIYKYQTWVEGGVKSGDICNKINEGVKSKVGEINGKIADTLKSFASFSFSRLYYLPGKAQHMGNVDDDVSLVLVPK